MQTWEILAWALPRVHLGLYYQSTNSKILELVMKKISSFCLHLEQRDWRGKVFWFQNETRVRLLFNVLEEPSS